MLQASRYTYLPSLLVLAPCLFNLVLRVAACVRRPVFLGGAVIWLVLFASNMASVQTYMEVWRTSENLYLHTVELNPLNSFHKYQLGQTLKHDHRSSEALPRFRDALYTAELAGDHRHMVMSASSIGFLANAKVGDLGEAEQDLRKALG